MPVRVLHVIGSIDAASGGSTTAVLAMLRAVRARGIAADLVSLDHGAGPDGTARVRDGLTVRVFPRQSGLYALSMPLSRWLDRHAADYDLLHVHGLFSHAPIAAARAARRSSVPYVLSVHGVLNRWGLETRRPWLKRVSLALFERRMLREAACVQFTSEVERSDAERLGLPLRPVVVPLCVGGTAVREPGTGRAPARILFVGRFDPIKRIDLLLDGFAIASRRNPDLELVVAGDGPAPVAAELRERARRLGIEPRVRWAGFVSAESRDALLRESTLLVLPSRFENFGFAAVEALAAGLPVVVSRGVAVAAQIEQAGAGLAFDGSAEQLAACLELALADPSLRERMSAAGHALVRREWSIEALGERLAGVYAAALAGRGMRPQ